MARSVEVFMVCPLCPDGADVTFQLGGSKGEGLEVTDVEGCEHARTFESGDMDPVVKRRFDAAIDAAIYDHASERWEGR